MLKVIDRLCTVIGVVCYISGSTRTFIEALGFVPLGITFTLCSCPNKRSRKILEQFRKTCVFCSPTEHKKKHYIFIHPWRIPGDLFSGEASHSGRAKLPESHPRLWDISWRWANSDDGSQSKKWRCISLYIYTHTKSCVYIYRERDCMYIYIFI